MKKAERGNTPKVRKRKRRELMPISSAQPLPHIGSWLCVGAPQSNKSCPAINLCFVSSHSSCYLLAEEESLTNLEAGLGSSGLTCHWQGNPTPLFMWLLGQHNALFPIGRIT